MVGGCDGLRVHRGRADAAGKPRTTSFHRLRADATQPLVIIGELSIRLQRCCCVTGAINREARARRRAGATANGFRPQCPVNALFGGDGYLNGHSSFSDI